MKLRVIFIIKAKYKEKDLSSIAKLNYKIVIISILDNFRKEDLLISIPEIKVSTLDIKKVDITMIDADAYWTNCKLKKAQIFVIFMKDLEYQVKKEARSKISQKTIVSKKYHDLLGIFSEKNSETFFLYQKYNHKIILKEE